MSKLSSRNKIYLEKKVNNFKELLNSTTKEFGANIAFTVKDKNKTLHDISFIDFNNTVKELGTALLNLHLKNDKIGILSPDRYEWCCSYFAIATSGNTIVPLDCLLPQIELEKLITRSGIKAVIFDSKFIPMMQSLKEAKSTSLEFLICMDSESDSDQIFSYSNLISTGQKLLENRRYSI